MPFDPMFFLPGQYGVGGELGTVAADDHAWAAADLDDAVEFAMTRRLVSEVSTTSPKHSRVKSSTSVRLSTRESYCKSATSLREMSPHAATLCRSRKAPSTTTCGFVSSLSSDVPAGRKDQTVIE